jgi:hypothetical protein
MHYRLLVLHTTTHIDMCSREATADLTFGKSMVKDSNLYVAINTSNGMVTQHLLRCNCTMGRRWPKG